MIKVHQAQKHDIVLALSHCIAELLVDGRLAGAEVGQSPGG